MPAAQWYTVHLDSPPQGTVGQTAASITSGNLHIDPGYDADGDGTAVVYADSATDAIRTALTGGVVVNLSAVNLPPASYTFTPNTSSPSTADHTAFAVTPTTAASWRVYLEDLSATPTVSDWDFNDFFWTVSAGQLPAPTLTELPTLSAALHGQTMSSLSKGLGDAFYGGGDAAALTAGVLTRLNGSPFYGVPPAPLLRQMRDLVAGRYGGFEADNVPQAMATLQAYLQAFDAKEADPLKAGLPGPLGISVVITFDSSALSQALLQYNPAITALVTQLGDDDFDTRVAAQASIITTITDAIAAHNTTLAYTSFRTLYDKGLFSTNAEIQFRAKAIIAGPALAPYQFALVRFAVNLADFATLDPAPNP